MAASLVIGLCLVTRYDSVFFVAPAALAVGARVRPRAWVAPAWLVGAAPLGAWLVFSARYYHALLPTSFYVKTPSLGIHQLFVGAGYLGHWIVLSGVLVPLVVSRFRRAKKGGALLALPPLGESGWVLGGLALEMAYAIFASTKHMMFSFRLFVPYLPAFAYLIARSLERVERVSPWWSGRALGAFSAACAAQLALGLIVLTVSSNPAPLADVEFRDFSLQGHMAYTRYLEGMAPLVRAHWLEQEQGHTRPARIMVLAAGVWPYRDRDDYFYDSLVSYRNACAPSGKRLVQGADYVLWDGDTFPGFQLVPGSEMPGRAAMRVLHQPHPRPNPLPGFVDEPCPAEAPP